MINKIPVEYQGTYFNQGKQLMASCFFCFLSDYPGFVPICLVGRNGVPGADADCQKSGW